MWLICLRCTWDTLGSSTTDRLVIHGFSRNLYKANMLPFLTRSCFVLSALRKVTRWYVTAGDHSAIKCGICLVFLLVYRRNDSHIMWEFYWGWATLLGTPKDMLCKALEIGACFRKGPILGNMGGGRSSRRAFERRATFIFIRTFTRKLRDMLKKTLETGNSLHKGPRWGPWRGFFFGTLWGTDGGLWTLSISY